MPAGPVAAHSWYDADCCSARDCAPIPASTVTLTGEGYAVTLHPGDHFMADADTPAHIRALARHLEGLA